MTNLAVRSAHWLEFFSDLLNRPLTRFPHAAIRDELGNSFDVVGTSWNWREADGRNGFELSASTPTHMFSSDVLDQWLSRNTVSGHPLVRWFAATRSTAPQTTARVPAVIAPSAAYREVQEEVLRPAGCDVQLSLPYHLDGLEHRAFVLARTGTDFHDDDLALAGLLQPILTALDRQISVLSAHADPFAGAATQVELTVRESAVLSLLAAGYPAVRIAHRLAISPRTVNKHLERIYRKLGVVDRLGAIRVASALGLLRVPPSRMSNA